MPWIDDSVERISSIRISTDNAKPMRSAIPLIPSRYLPAGGHFEDGRAAARHDHALRKLVLLARKHVGGNLRGADGFAEARHVELRLASELFRTTMTFCASWPK